MLFAADVGKRSSKYLNERDRVGNNREQNRQFDEAVRQLRSKYKINMTQERRQQLHKEISHLGYGLEEIIQVGLDMFKGD